MSALFSFTPTFTQGLVLGQISIIGLLFIILKYLFLDSAEQPRSVDPPALKPPPPRSSLGNGNLEENLDDDSESAEWFNLLLQQVVQAYRSELRNNALGPTGDEAARVKVEKWANDHRGSSLFDKITIHSVNIGSSAPKLSHASIKPNTDASDTSTIDCKITYTDTVSISLSTSVLFHYPTPSFARLPVSISMSLSLFSGTVTIVPPSLLQLTPCLTMTLNPNFTLDLSTTSLMGSRAKLADVPKIHEIIEQRIRSMVAQKGTWRVLLPGVRPREVAEILEKKRK